MDDLDARKKEILSRLNAKIKAARAFNSPESKSRGSISAIPSLKGAKPGEQYIKEMRMRINQNSSNINKTTSKFHALMQDNSESSSQNSVASSLRICSEGRVRDFLAQKRNVDSKTVYKKPWIGGSEIGKSSKTDQARSSLSSMSSLNAPYKPQAKLPIKSILKPARTIERPSRPISRKSNVSEASTSKSSKKSIISKKSQISLHTERNSSESEPSSPELDEPPQGQSKGWTILTKKPKPLDRESIESQKAPSKALSAPQNPSQSSDISKCKYCSRPFNMDRLEKHQSICFKTQKSKKTRGKFDSKQMRIQGTETEISLKRSKSAPSKSAPSKSNWRKNHQDFIKSLRQAKAISAHIAKGGKASDLPTITTVNDGTPCPHCSRKFGESSFERHVKICANLKHFGPRK